MTRKEANLQILARITKYINQYPDMRFGQALRNLGVIVDVSDPIGGEPKWMNHFMEEPTSMIKRMNEEEKKWSMT